MMVTTIKLEGGGAVKAELESRAIRARRDRDAKVVVAYVMEYAIYVHEDLEAHHAEGTQAKFLEEPARRLREVLADIIRVEYQRSGSIKNALMLAGLRLQRESQMIVPVDTGALRASAFTAFIEDIENETNAARIRAQVVRMASRLQKSRRCSFYFFCGRKVPYWSPSNHVT